MRMKKVMFSIVEKRLIRTMLILGLVQILIMFTFIRMFNIGQPISTHDTKQTDIIVEDIYLISTRKEQWLVIIADSEKYLFESHSIFDTYPLEELNKSISKGDKLSLRYYEEYNIFGKANMIVDARTATENYRTFEEFNHAKQGVSVFVVIIFSIIEIVFAGIIFVYIWLNYSIFKGVYRKIKNHKHRDGTKPLKKTPEN